MGRGSSGQAQRARSGSREVEEIQLVARGWRARRLSKPKDAALVKKDVI